MISYTTFISADNTDVLNGTDLANMPSDGILTLYIASTQNDTVFTLTGPGQEPAARLIRVPQRTNGQASLADDLGWSIPVLQGGRYILNVDVVTAATVGITAIFQPA